MSEELKGFKKMVDKMPAIDFIQRFEKAFVHAAIARYGPIIPNNQKELHQLAKEVLQALTP